MRLRIHRDTSKLHIKGAKNSKTACGILAFYRHNHAFVNQSIIPPKFSRDAVAVD